MSSPYVGEIRLFGGNFPPQGWAFCDGQLLSIAENDVLFTLIGTTFGGDGQSTFALPDLRGRIPVCAGSSYVIGSSGGAETVTLARSQLPVHAHSAACQSAAGNQGGPQNAVWASSPANQYAAGAANAAMNPAQVSAFGGSQPHDNMMPYLPLSFIISLYGIYPSQG